MSKRSQCGLSIEWRKEQGRWHCYNADGSVHWDRCSQARFERIKQTGIPFFKKDEEGYLTNLKKSGVQLTRQTAKMRIPKGVKVVPCTHDKAPWESCDICDMAA